MVDDLEALSPRRIVCAADVHDLLELGVGVVAEEVHDGDDGRRRDVEGQLVLVDARLLDELWQRRHNPRAVLLQLGRVRLEVLDGVATRRLRVGRLLARRDCVRESVSRSVPPIRPESRATTHSASEWPTSRWGGQRRRKSERRRRQGGTMPARQQRAGESPPEEQPSLCERVRTNDEPMPLRHRRRPRVGFDSAGRG